MMGINTFSSGSYNVQVGIWRSNIFILLLIFHSPYSYSTTFLLINHLQMDLIRFVILTNFSIEEVERN
ncbi:hypothetical protein JHK82_044462 [Glycine max]|uniref:Uncharacterized protein n=1 Tax=Glycine max TaxID=3847 RepID=A0A0R0FXS8_SOYBN|nr:hypothetical protein JHK86_044811 [Glycine max]KAG4940786.1 hypothetical protein JHK87_044657 [Glycine soja]KAG4951561.1 hypothetical protein JHK85_045428 [Glycine max]KAG5099410.1 hypothetical protein JHK82_044462 [Glycine max]KAG5108016.1 hypothetical protein JHK84_044923 [Glycine max]